MATVPCSVIEYVYYSRAMEEKKYCVVGAIKVHDSLTHCLSDHLYFLHDTCILMLDVPRVGKRMNKAHAKKRVEKHRFLTTEKEQGTSRWSVCPHNILYYLAI